MSDCNCDNSNGCLVILVAILIFMLWGAKETLEGIHDALNKPPVVEDI